MGHSLSLKTSFNCGLRNTERPLNSDPIAFPQSPVLVWFALLSLIILPAFPVLVNFRINPPEKGTQKLSN